jgi:hypothetical protein
MCATRSKQETNPVEVSVSDLAGRPGEFTGKAVTVTGRATAVSKPPGRLVGLRPISEHIFMPVAAPDPTDTSPVLFELESKAKHDIMAKITLENAAAREKACGSLHCGGIVRITGTVSEVGHIVLIDVTEFKVVESGYADLARLLYRIDSKDHLN